ncbi:MAG TPA: DNA-processing protein DprA [Acidimicrobiales bacterium]|nr:DNA-processing protein DprA [Acidimicrobiales bacterium]
MSCPADDLPEWAHAVALAGLPYMTWDRLARVLAGPGGEGEPATTADGGRGARRPWSPAEAWQRVVAGGWGEGLARAAAATPLAEVADAHRRAGVAVHLLGGEGFPAALAHDHEAPPVLFSFGDLAVLQGPRVGIVGTRRATGYGRDVARQLGRELAEAGVAVVSGLALGIDGAAHEGALGARAPAAPPVGVVGSGLDVVYPRRHADLWRRVALAGVLLSEAPLGARPEPWRFPARNRLIAALADVLVVVESHAAGGSLHTVRAAAERGVTVMAVPGPVRSPASAGTNALLADGCPPARDSGDVLVALALETAAAPPRPDRRPPPTGEEAAVLDALGWQPVTVEELVEATSLPPSRVALALARLEQDGWARGRGGWWERVAPS